MILLTLKQLYKKNQQMDYGSFHINMARTFEICLKDEQCGPKAMRDMIRSIRLHKKFEYKNPKENQFFTSIFPSIERMK